MTRDSTSSMGWGIRDEHAIASLAKLSFRVVVLIGDVADNLLDEILDTDQPVGPAIFVDDDCHMDAGGLHLHQQIGRPHRGRNEQQWTDQPGLPHRYSKILGPQTMPWLAASSGVLGTPAAARRAKLFSVIQRMKSLMWTMPEGSSRVSRKTGRRE